MNTPMPPKLSEKILSYAQVELSPRATLIRFYLVMLIGAMITLIVCPQFGVGNAQDGHGLIPHGVMPHGDMYYGAFCSALFVGVGTFCSVMALSRAQWRWIWRHHFWVTIPPVASAFFILMLIKVAGNYTAIHETPSYYFGWLITGPVTCWLILRTIKVVKPI